MPRSRLFRILLAFATIGPIAFAGHLHAQEAPARIDAPSAKEEVLTLISDTLRIDTTYHSMEGPYHQVRFTIGPAGGSDIVWVTAMSADVVTPDLTPLPVEFFCHANLDYDAQAHRELFKTKRITTPRLFTLSQGAEVMRFPEGFGIPVRTDEPLTLTTQVLSNNGIDAPKDVRVRIRLNYVKTGERPMKPLFLTAAMGAVATDGHKGHYGMHDNHEMGASTSGVAKTQSGFQDALGQKFTGHWIVPPGKHRVRSVVTKLMNLDSDVQVHYIGVHVHPFAKQITLRDMTTGKDVFSSQVTPLDGRIGISKVTDFSSPDGLRLYDDHHYELIADYENTTSNDVDAMAVLFLYVRDQELRALEKP